MTQLTSLASSERRPRHRLRFAPVALDGIHLLWVGTAAYAIRSGCDASVWPTVVGYGPRWVLLLPGVLLVVGQLLRRRAPWVALLVSGAAVVLLTDYNVPVAGVTGGSARVRVLTLNVNAAAVASPAFGRLAARFDPDVLAMQECPGDAGLPDCCGRYDTRRERGVVLASRWPVRQCRWFSGPALGGEGVLLACRLERTPGRFLWAVTLHLETPRRGLTPFLEDPGSGVASVAASIARRTTISANAARWVRQIVGDEDVIILGDFNLVADGRPFRRSWSAWHDAFADAGWGVGGTKLEPGWRVRIDHVLSSDAWRASRCWVGDDVGSDHLPLLAELWHESE